MKKERRYQELARAVSADEVLIKKGYRLAWAGGIFGISIGRELAQGYKVLPDGKKVYKYRLEDRKQGEQILKIAVIFTFIELMAVALYSILKT